MPTPVPQLCMQLLYGHACAVDTMQMELLGKSLVVWADSKGQWHCLEDRCPHRMARLSEGRVEGDNIQVSSARNQV
jgi:phenylpropionate dioxygenase-like ring-hydroxylating dioxygenase large terminal subunit